MKHDPKNHHVADEKRKGGKGAKGSKGGSTTSPKGHVAVVEVKV